MSEDPKVKRLFLDDLAPGDSYVSASYLVDADQIKAFAGEFDPQPFHLDELTAQATFFRGLAASGWHTAAITMRLLVESVPFDCGLIGLGSELSWPAPTRPGDQLHVRSVIVSIAPSASKRDRGVVTVQSETLNQDGHAVQRMEAKLLVLRR